MKLYAQVGHGPGEKLNVGLSEGLIDGAIFSPKDMARPTLKTRIGEIRRLHPKADLLLDPQFYVSLFAALPTTNLGNIQDWQFFRAYRKSELELPKTVEEILKRFFEEVVEIDVTGIIAPNVHISQSFDSREAVIAKSFIRQTKPTFVNCGDTRPVYASLLVCRETLQDRREFEEFLNDITMLEEPPDGVYLIVSGHSSEARSDFFHTDVLTNWMLLNLSLSVNGLQTINGYSDILTPFLGAVGANAGATGWWSNLRMFSMDRFFPSGGGRLPIQRYLSKALLNRITFQEKDAISLFCGSIINGLPHDADYSPEPDRSVEVLQSWEAIRSLNTDIVIGDLRTGLDNCRRTVEHAKEVYAEIAAQGLPLDAKSRDDHLTPLEEALDQFKQRAGLA